jgi:hypothetical protein
LEENQILFEECHVYSCVQTYVLDIDKYTSIWYDASIRTTTASAGINW